MDTFIALWFMLWGNSAYNELTAPPPQTVTVKLPVDPKLYYPDLTDEMWDPEWINKKG